MAALGAQLGFPDTLRREAFQLRAHVAAAQRRKRDAVVVQAVRAYDELLESENRLNERLREWYGLHFPELARLVPTERYAGAVAQGGEREEVLVRLGLPGLWVPPSELTQADLSAVRSFAATSEHVRREAETQARALESAMGSVAPNLAHLLGPLLGARLIESAGSLTRLARMPASTIQLLGAERALFRHLREGKPPPKHGVLFQHPAVHTSPVWARGKMARALSGKAAIAARIDSVGARTGEGAKLRAAFERRATEILARGASKGNAGAARPKGQRQLSSRHAPPATTRPPEARKRPRVH